MNDHLYDIVRQRAARLPLAPVLGGQEGLTWRALDGAGLLAAVDGLAEELADRLGVRAGDRVILWVPNSWRTPVYFFACWRLGAVVVPFDRETNPEAAARIVASTEPRAVVVGYDERPAWTRGLPNVVEWWAPSAEGSPRAPWTRPTEELAALYFTSGTTGQPKGCEITHANLLSQVAVLDRNIALGPDDRLCSVLPLSHLFELTCGLLYPVAAGASVHYAPSRRGPDVLRVLREQRVTHMIGVPQLLALMGENVDAQLRARLPAWAYRAAMAAADRLPLGARRRLPTARAVHARLGGHLRMLASGGAPLAPATQRLWEQLGVRVVQGYGTSECSPVVAAGAADGSTPVGWVGRPIDGVAVRVADDGEVLVRGPNVMRGYWRDPERTAEVLDAEGWYRTGDLGELDAAGNLRLTGRARDMIVLPSGQKVHPTDVEDVLRAGPLVKDAAVVAAPTASGGVNLHAYLIPSGERAPLAPVLAAANARLAQHQRLARASWWPDADFPRTSTLKVRRALLPAPAVAAPETVAVDRASAADDPIGQAVAAAARAERVPDSALLAELGIDSLAMVELVVTLEEKTGKRLGDHMLRGDMTVAELRATLGAAPDAEAADAGADDDAGPSVPLWPYTWGRVFRRLAAPLDWLYAATVPETVVLGAEHLAALPPRTVLAGNHHSFADQPLVRQALRRAGPRGLADRLVAAAMAEGTAWATPRGKLAALLLGVFPLERQRGRAASLRRLAEVAAAGNPVLIFPQGRHATPADEQADPPRVRFKTGVAHLAAALGAEVVPFGLAGSEAVIPPHTAGHRTVAGIPLALCRQPLAIAFGAPLRPADGEAPQAFAARVERASYALAADAAAALARVGGAALASPLPLGEG